MDIGVSLILTGPSPVAEVFAKVAAAGFRRVELSCHDDPAGTWWHDPSGARAALAAAGLVAPTVHSPDAGWDNDAPDDAVRRASIDAASSVFVPAREAGVETVIVHPNAPASHSFLAAEFEMNLARAKDSLRILAERAAQAGVKLAVENLPMRHLPRPGGRIEDTLRLIDSLGDHVGVCFDVGHSNANALDPVAEIRAAAGRILCVHVQDNDGLGEDQHLLPGDGTVNWPRVIDALATFAPDASSNFEIGLGNRNVDELLSTLASLRREWTGK